MAKFLELKKNADGTQEIVGSHDTSSDLTPKPSLGGDRCIHVPDATYYMLKAVRYDIHLAFGLLNGVQRVLRGGRR